MISKSKETQEVLCNSTPCPSPQNKKGLLRPFWDVWEVGIRISWAKDYWYKTIIIHVHVCLDSETAKATCNNLPKIVDLACFIQSTNTYWNLSHFRHIRFRMIGDRWLADFAQPLGSVIWLVNQWSAVCAPVPPQTPVSSTPPRQLRELERLRMPAHKFDGDRDKIHHFEENQARVFRAEDTEVTSSGKSREVSSETFV